MKLTSTCFALACGLCTLLGSRALAQHSGEHIMLAPSELTWKDLPSLPGVKIAVIEGQLNQAVPIMFRLKFPANFKVPPHWHPGVEHITIISGTLHWERLRQVEDPRAHARQRLHHAAGNPPLCVDR
jgi:hypothetical protein